MGWNVIFRRAGEQRVWRDGDGAPAELAAHAPGAEHRSRHVPGRSWGKTSWCFPASPSCHFILAAERAELLISLKTGEELTGKGGRNAS